MKTGKKLLKRIGVCAAISLTAVFVMVGAAGCSGKVETDISSYDKDEIKVEGLGEKPFHLTPSELAQMDCVNKTVKTRTKKGEIKVKASGPDLKTFLDSRGYRIEDINNVTFTAKDGYTKAFDRDFLSVHNELILSVAKGDEALEDDEAPLRLVIPGAEAENWVKGVVSVKFE